MEKFLSTTSVNALMLLFGMEIGVKMRGARADKNGMEQNVFVIQAYTSMEAYAYSASMDKFGTQLRKNVNVKKITFGMETSVRSLRFVLGTESTTKLLISVFAKMDNFGMVSLAWFNLNVAVGSYGTRKVLNVNVLIISIGMEICVCSASMGRSGMKSIRCAFVGKAPSGTINSVLLCSNALEA